MNNDKGLQIFSFESNNVRVVMKGSEPWFVAKDVCGVLEIQNARDTIAKVLDDDEKGVTRCDTPGGAQEMSIISGSGLYALIMRSHKPEARRFRKWVTAEVLPTIRKHGIHTTEEMVDSVAQ